MKMRIKSLGIVLMAALLLMLPLLSGCRVEPPAPNPGDEYEVRDSEDLDKNAALELSIMTSTDGKERKIVEGLASGFNKEFPNITFKITPLSGNIYESIMGYYNANIMPDIFLNESLTMLTLGAAGTLLDLSPYIKADTANGTFNANDYYENFWRLGQKNWNGGQWMAPRAADQVVISFNKLKMIEAGIDLNPATTKVKNGWTWDDFLEVCAELREHFDNTGRGNLYLADGYLNWEANFNAILSSWGVQYFGEDESLIDSAATRSALNMMKNLVEKKYVASFNASSQANFDGGQGVFLLHSRAASLTADILKEVYKTQIANGTYAIDDIFDVVTFPLIGANPKVGAGVAGYSIASTIDATKRDYAWQFLKYMLSKDGQNNISQSGANYPPMRKDMADPFADGVKWGEGMEKFNLAAYTWASQPGHNYVCPTEFVLKRPAFANDLIFEVSSMIGGYLNSPALIGSTAANSKLNSVISDCKDNLEYWAFAA